MGRRRRHGAGYFPPVCRTGPQVQCVGRGIHSPADRGKCLSLLRPHVDRDGTGNRDLPSGAPADTTAFRLVDGRLRCCHIHISNPYGEMADEDVGFPTRMAEESTRYLREQVELQKQQLADQTEQLRRMSYEDRLTGLYNQNRFNELRGQELLGRGGGIGVVCLDLNGLKDVNDRQGHTAGDAMLCGAAEQMRQIFPDRVYRTGGDEFVVVEDLREEAAFRHAVETLRQGMRQAGISCSVGVSWRTNPGNIGQQYDEADQRMYEEKRSYYSMQTHDRRTRRK